MVTRIRIRHVGKSQLGNYYNLQLQSLNDLSEFHREVRHPPHHHTGYEHFFFISLCNLIPTTKQLSILATVIPFFTETIWQRFGLTGQMTPLTSNSGFINPQQSVLQLLTLPSCEERAEWQFLAALNLNHLTLLAFPPPSCSFIRQSRNEDTSSREW